MLLTRTLNTVRASRCSSAHLTQTRKYAQFVHEKGLLRVFVNHDSWSSVQEAAELVKNKLFVQLELEEDVSAYDQEDLMMLIGKIYTIALRTSLDLDADVLFPFSALPETTLLNNTSGVIKDPTYPIILGKAKEKAKSFKNTVLGGTFDRFHAGHKLLLTKAVLNSTDSILIGITTDGPLLSRKSYGKMIEPYPLREEKVRQFMEIVCPHLKIKTVPLDDIYGPSIKEEDLDAIVVSSETREGAKSINDLRKMKGWKPLEILEIGRGESASATTNGKEVSTWNVSSSYLRRREYELKEVEKLKGKQKWALAGE